MGFNFPDPHEFRMRGTADALSIDMVADSAWLLWASKRLCDVVIAALALLVFAPVMLAVAAAIKWDSRGPVLFCQNRLGRRNRPFRIYKFRTMHVQDDGPVVVQATRNDPRVTRLGRLLRKSSLDELPQLFNVIRGEMSLVGPRPHAVAHDQFYDMVIPDYSKRRLVTPGLTGWAQVNGARGETPSVESMAERVQLDLWYVRNCSLALDCKILLKTFVEVLNSSRAY
ncbi:exopolysaccharide biosynthesis polyprenyl glycosylphosphotransferase [Alsobacter sp. KACC 23698]|uniref:Exopolysaccharide biosynthesis polyprenyl glycosylphosphotransferase n=1 Tax=Alsobacter sp. KACC 23698 TaxID=3149229 RepID=A0AAU7JJD7_9HYPH